MQHNIASNHQVANQIPATADFYISDTFTDAESFSFVGQVSGVQVFMEPMWRSGLMSLI